MPHQHDWLQPGAPADLLDQLTDRIVGALGADLLGLYAYGSLVTGDFAPARSDLDLLAVLRVDPEARTVDVLARCTSVWWKITRRGLTGSRSSTSPSRP